MQRYIAALRIRALQCAVNPSHFRCDGRSVRACFANCSLRSARHALLQQCMRRRLHKAACLLVQTSGRSHFRCERCLLQRACTAAAVHAQTFAQSSLSACANVCRLHKATLQRCLCKRVQQVPFVFYTRQLAACVKRPRAQSTSVPVLASATRAQL